MKPQVGEIWYPRNPQTNLHEWVYIQFAEGNWINWQYADEDGYLGHKFTVSLQDFMEEYRP